MQNLFEESVATFLPFIVPVRVREGIEAKQFSPDNEKKICDSHVAFVNVNVHALVNTTIYFKRRSRIHTVL